MKRMPNEKLEAFVKRLIEDIEHGAKFKIAKNLIALKKLTVEEISNATELPFEEVKELNEVLYLFADE